MASKKLQYGNRKNKRLEWLVIKITSQNIKILSIWRFIMGWTYMKGATRSDIIGLLLEEVDNDDYQSHILAHCLRGNVLWSVWECCERVENKSKRFIGCDLLSFIFDGKIKNWGYKRMSEACHPYYYTCPVRYLNLVSDEDVDTICLAWRELVRNYHRLFYQKLSVGDRVNLKNCVIPEVEITNIKPLRGTYGGEVFRIPRKLLGEKISVTNDPTNQGE